MSNALQLNANNPVKLNEAFGFAGRPKPTIPILKVNGSDDDNGTKAPKGSFVYDDGDRILYTKEVNIRAFLKAFQYRLYDDNNKENNDTSIIAPDFKAEFRSVSGRIACGKLSKKKFEQLGESATSMQRYYQEKTACKLIIFGLVSGTFTDLDTKEYVTVEDALFNFSVSQSAFIAMDAAIKGIEAERRPVPLTPIKLTLKKDKKGSVTFFVPIPEVLPVTVPLVQERDLGYLTKIKDYVKDTNDYVNSKYEAAIRTSNANEEFAEVNDAVNTIEGTASVLDDDLPI